MIILRRREEDRKESSLELRRRNGRRREKIVVRSSYPFTTQPGARGQRGEKEGNRRFRAIHPASLGSEATKRCRRSERER